LSGLPEVDHSTHLKTPACSRDGNDRRKTPAGTAAITALPRLQQKLSAEAILRFCLRPVGGANRRSTSSWRRDMRDVSMDPIVSSAAKGCQHGARAGIGGERGWGRSHSERGGNNGGKHRTQRLTTSKRSR
jgi:hypothetical protein